MNFTYTKKVLPCGLRVVYHRALSPMVTLNLWAGVGVKDEEPGKNGISHFFEHMVFKGTRNYPGLQLARQVQAIGGTINAGTSLDTTDFYIVVPGEHWKQALALQTELIFHPLFDGEDIEREKNVVIQEIHLDEDDPEERLARTLYENVFFGTPYGRSILGTEYSVAQFNRDDLIRHQESFYHPYNLTLSFSGNISEAEVFEEIENQFVQWVKLFKSPFLPFPPFPVSKERRLDISMDVHHHYGTIGFLCPGIKDDDFYPLRFLSVIMGDGIGSRLNIRLREKEKMVDSIHTAYSYYQKAGIFSILYTYAEGEHEKIEEVIQEEFQALRSHPPRKEEIIRARNLLLSGFYHSIETTLGSAELLGRLDIIDNIDTIFRYIMNIERIQTEHIMDVFQKYIDFGRATTVFIRPEDRR